MHNKSNDNEVKYKQLDDETANKIARKLRNLRQEKYQSKENFKIDCEMMEVPATYESMINFERILYKEDSAKKKQSVKGMRLATFYELCEFYKVSPNYLLYDKASRHIEDTADKIKEDWGITDDILDMFKFVSKHTKTSIDNMSEMEFLELFLKECFMRIEGIAGNYIGALKSKYEFENEYMNKDNGFIKDKYISNETELINTYQDLQGELTLYKLEILKLVEKFLESIYKKSSTKK